MVDYEYRVLHMPTTSISVLNERVNADAQDGWEPYMMSGSDFINIVMRRPIREGEQQDRG